LILVPCLPIVDDVLLQCLRDVTVPVLIGARTGSKTPEFSVPTSLPPGLLQTLLPLRVTRVESLREGFTESGEGFKVRLWFEHVETALPAEWSLSDGRGVLYRHRNLRYLAGVLDDSALQRLIGTLAAEADVPVRPLPEGVRLRRLGELQFAFNYSAQTVSIRGCQPDSATCLLGGPEMGPAAVAVWREDSIEAP
jgi:beta-galactosidase